MREILFRGKYVGTGEWVYGIPAPDKRYDPSVEDYVLTDTVIMIDAYYEFDRYEPKRIHCFRICPETVGQWTGLVDRNGTKIFEGDIVRGKFLSNRSRQKFKVVFKDGMFLFDNGVIAVDHRDIISLEVIGNIHDNPELVRKE